MSEKKKRRGDGNRGRRPLGHGVPAARGLRAAAEKKLARIPRGEASGRAAESLLHELQVHQVELEMQNDELKRAQVALEESRDKYLGLYDFAPAGYFTLTPGGRIAEVNLAGAAMLGGERPRLVGRGLGRFVAPEGRDQWDQHLVSVLHSAEKQTCELTLRRADGSSFDAHLDSLRQDRRGQESGEGGAGPAIHVAMSDITYLKRAEALRESEEKYRTLFHTMAQGVIYLDASGRIVSANPAAERILGLSLDQSQGRAPNDRRWRAVHEDGSDFADETHPSMVSLRTGKEVRDVIMGVLNPRRKSYVWISVCAVPQFRAGESQPYQVYATFDDITEQRNLREQFAQAQRMEAIGQLAGGVAHDFRNQLMVIKGYGELLLRRSLVGKAGREPMEQILKAAERCEAISGQLLAFSRQQVLRPEVIDVTSATGDMMKSMAQTLGEDIKTSILSCDGLWSIRVDTGQFQQALLNLVLNARDAMPKGGQLTIEIENVVLEEEFVRQHVGASAGRHVVLTVSDNGAGMDRETLGHIFEPFFTTKPVGQGTGLGLAMVHGFVAQSCGFIEVQSQLKHGTRFRLHFPAVEDAAGSARQCPETRDLRRGSGTVLVVEDEEAIRRILVETLGECGYAVLAAGSAQEAMAVIESVRGSIDLLITDVVMPGWSGPELAKHFLAVRPGGRVLMVSGHTGGMLTGHGVVPPEVNLLIKPFSSRTLAKTVAKILCRPRRR